MPETQIPIDEGQKASADDSPNAQRVVINWMVDSNKSIRLRPAVVNTVIDPGTYSVSTGTQTGLIGMYVWRSVFDLREYLIYVRQDRKIFAKDLLTNVVTSLSDSTTATQLDGNGAVAIFTEDTQRLVIAGGGQLQVWVGTGLSARIGPFTLGVTQPPTSATHVVAVANYLVANQAALPGTNTQIYWSNLFDSNHATWNPLNFTTADADPDPIVALSANLREVFSFGAKSLQVFGQGADPLAPFVPSAALAIGCSAPYSVIRVDASFAFLDDTRRFVMSDGRGAQVISHDIMKLIRDLGTVSDCIGFRFRSSYWDLLVWIFPTEGKAWAYDTDRQQWHQWRGHNGVDDYAGIRINAFAYWQSGNLNIVGDPKFENIWTLDTGSASDTGPAVPLLAERVTGRIDQETSTKKRCKCVRFFVRRGTTAQPSTTPVYLEAAKRDDDGPWCAPKLIDLGIAGDFRSYADWYPGGIYRRRQYRLRYSGGIDIAITHAVEQWDALDD